MFTKFFSKNKETAENPTSRINKKVNKMNIIDFLNLILFFVGIFVIFLLMQKPPEETIALTKKFLLEYRHICDIILVIALTLVGGIFYSGKKFTSSAPNRLKIIISSRIASALTSVICAYLYFILNIPLVVIFIFGIFLAPRIGCLLLDFGVIDVSEWSAGMMEK